MHKGILKATKFCWYCGNNVPKRRRKYCSDKCQVDYFEENIAPLWWNFATKRALVNAGHKCQHCGGVMLLEVHHKESLKPGESRHNNLKNKQDNLIVLCRSCHSLQHKKVAILPLPITTLGIQTKFDL